MKTITNAAGTLLTALSLAAVAQAPIAGKSIRIVVPYSPGGGTDVLSRVLGRKLGERWGVSVVIDNRPGAGGIIGTELAARSAPDGHTLVTIPSTHAINPSLFRKLPYDPIKDFTAVATIATSPNILVTHPSLPVKSARELIALAKRRPGELTYGSAGIGATTHLAGELFRSMAKIDTVHVPYKGSGQAQIDLVAGQVLYMVDSLPSALPQVRAGKTRALGVSGRTRFPTLPDVPPIAESGLPGYESVSWWGLLGPAGMSAATVERLYGEISRIMALPDVGEAVLNQGAQVWNVSPDEFLRHIRAETELYARVIRAAGIKVE